MFNIFEKKNAGFCHAELISVKYKMLKIEIRSLYTYGIYSITYILLFECTMSEEYIMFFKK